MIDSQLDLFPLLSPETLLAYVRRLETMLLKYAPELTRGNCQQLLGELAIVTDVMEAIGRPIEQLREWQHRQTLPPPNPAATLVASERIAFTQIVIPHRRRGRAAGEPTHNPER